WKSPSENPAASPAPDSTVKSKPDLTSFEATSGVTATRFSPGTVSRGTPIFMRAPPMSRDLIRGAPALTAGAGGRGEVYLGAHGRGSEAIVCGARTSVAQRDVICAVVGRWRVR